MRRAIRACVMLCGLLGSAAGAGADTACPEVSTQQGSEDTTLSSARAALLSGGEVNVLAVGTTIAQDSDPLETLRTAIGAALPEARLQITATGHHGMAAGELLDAMRVALEAKRYSLVVWQTGTWEAARNLNPEEFQDALEQGAALAQQSGADLVLVDPQFSRFLQANADVNAYLSVMQLVAALPNVGLFHRFALTHEWAEDAAIDVEHADKSAKLAETARLQHCVGAALSDYILAITVRRGE